METSNSILGVNLASKALAFAAALVTTAFLATSMVVVFTGSTQAFSAQLVRAVATPVRALLGG